MVICGTLMSKRLFGFFDTHFWFNAAFSFSLKNFFFKFFKLIFVLFIVTWSFDSKNNVFFIISLFSMVFNSFFLAICMLEKPFQQVLILQLYCFSYAF